MSLSVEGVAGDTVGVVVGWLVGDCVGSFEGLEVGCDKLEYMLG